MRSRKKSLVSVGGGAGSVGSGGGRVKAGRAASASVLYPRAPALTLRLGNGP